MIGSRGRGTPKRGQHGGDRTPTGKVSMRTRVVTWLSQSEQLAVQQPQPRDLRAEGERRVPQLFMHSDHAKWSAYAASQLGARQGSTGPPIEEAIALEPKLAAELHQLFARAREQMPPSGGAAGSDISSELEGDMARAAATSLQAALLELLDAAEADVPHVWADEAPAAALRVRAYMRGWRSQRHSDGPKTGSGARFAT